MKKNNKRKVGGLIMKFKRKEGITLIALVITIIILLILAGISISALSGSGLFKNAQLAKQKSENAEEKENATLEEYQQWLTNYIGETTPGEPETPKTYNVGDEVTVGAEQYFVISDKGTTVELLAKYILNSATTAQEDEKVYCAFSTDNYWKNETLPSSSPYFNLNTYPAVQNDTGSAVYKANNYAKSLGAISARLLTYEEEEEHDSTTFDVIFMTYAKNRNYWLGSAENDKWVKGITGDSINGWNFKTDNVLGIRPVIEISKSLVK